MFLDQVACELGETIPLAVTMKDRAEDAPERAIGNRGYAARPVLHADVSHATQEQATQMVIGKVRGMCKFEE